MFFNNFNIFMLKIKIYFNIFLRKTNSFEKQF
jgi:hypothetical protein